MKTEYTKDEASLSGCLFRRMLASQTDYKWVGNYYIEARIRDYKPLIYVDNELQNCFVRSTKMKRYFNTTGLCRPDRHYMVGLGKRLEEIREMIDGGEYFTVNKARQYGKTTLFYALAGYLRPWYVAVSLDFQLLSQSDFALEAAFVAAFAREIMNGACDMGEVPEGIASRLKEMAKAENEDAKLGELFGCLSDWCAQSPKPVVLIDGR